MSTALTYLYTIFDRFIAFIFNDMNIVSGVSVGWVIISIFIISFVLSNLLIIPSGIEGRKEHKKHG